MRKNIMAIIAVVLLAAAGTSRGVITTGLNGVDNTEFAGDPETEFEPGPESEPEPELDSELLSDGMIPENRQPGLLSESDTGGAPEDRPEAETAESETIVREENEIETEAPSSAEKYNPGWLAAEFTVLSTHEAVVKTYGELKSALADDNGITTVYFGDNITMQAGIKINPNKADVAIVGLNPLDPDRTQPYTLTDIDSASFFATIYVDEAGTRTLSIRDLTMVGKNFYGPFSVADISELAGLVVTYERVSYNGPQLCHHRRGTARFVNSSARIHGDNGVLSPHQEFAEAKHLVFEGANTIEHTASTNTIFWHPLGGSFQVADDSSLVITSPNTSVAYGVFYADGYANKLDILVGSRSVLDMTISGVVAPELYVTIRSVAVHEGGAFRLKTTKAATAAVLRVGGEFVIGKDAEFTVNGAGGASQSVIRQQGGNVTVGKDAVFRIIAENRYAALLNLVGCELICNDPASVLLYNTDRVIVATTSAGKVHINAQQVNYWNAAAPSGFDFPPLYGWRKADRSNFMIDGALAIGSSANFSTVLSNYTAGDPPGLPPDKTTFNMASSRVLAFGRLELIAAEPAAKSDSVGGMTVAGASVRVSFTQQGVNYTFPDVIADSNGGFHVPVGVELDAGTVIKIKSSWQYLTAEEDVTVAGKGSLGLFAPGVLEFYTTPLSPFKKTVKRLNPDWKIVVSDARGIGGKWSVYAKLGQEMLPGSPHLPALNGALTFVDDLGKVSVLNTDADILILEHMPSVGEDVLPIVWDEDKGILLDIPPGTAFVNTPYSATICWTIVDGV